MRRRILLVLLALGAFGGFAAGFAHLRCHRGSGGWHGRWHARHAAYEAHVAQICTDAALRARAEPAPR